MEDNCKSCHFKEDKVHFNLDHGRGVSNDEHFHVKFTRSP